MSIGLRSKHNAAITWAMLLTVGLFAMLVAAWGQENRMGSVDIPSQPATELRAILGTHTLRVPVALQPILSGQALPRQDIRPASGKQAAAVVYFQDAASPAAQLESVAFKAAGLRAWAARSTPPAPVAGLDMITITRVPQDQRTPAPAVGSVVAGTAFLRSPGGKATEYNLQTNDAMLFGARPSAFCSTWSLTDGDGDVCSARVRLVDISIRIDIRTTRHPLSEWRELFAAVETLLGDIGFTRGAGN
jgi:hypothetical protein